MVAGTLTVVLAAVAGCGKKGPPHPPPRLIPAQTTDLMVHQTGDRLVLDLAYPAVTTSGMPLAGIAALEVLALRAPPTAPGAPPAGLDPRTFGATAPVVKRLEAAEVVAATRGPRLTVVLDAAPGSPLGSRPEHAAAAVPVTPPVVEQAPATTPGAPPSEDATPTPTAAPPGPPPLLIAIRTFGPRGNESPLSNLVAILPRTPPPTLSSLVATATAGGVQLAWTTSPGAPVAAGFDLLRRRAGEDGFETRVAQAGAGQLEHLDATAIFGDSYEYTVRTVAARDPLVESVDGPVAAIAYQDTFAPPAPSGLVALAEEGRIRLLWDRVEAPDLAGYRLYRQENDGAEIELERPPGAGNDHIDDRVRAGATYTYRATAADREGNESARSEPVTASPR